jgi:hypothetical protein
MKMEQTECSETSAYKIQMPGNYPEENIQHSKTLCNIDIFIKIYVGIAVVYFPFLIIIFTDVFF